MEGTCSLEEWVGVGRFPTSAYSKHPILETSGIVGIESIEALCWALIRLSQEQGNNHLLASKCSRDKIRGPLPTCVSHEAANLQNANEGCCLKRDTPYPNKYIQSFQVATFL